MRPGLDLDQGHHTVRLDRDHPPRKAVAGGEAVTGAMPRRGAPEPLHLRRGHAAAVALVANRLELPGAVPTAQRVDADAERLRRVAQAEVGSHCLSIA